MKILTVDIGTGTQDILLYDSRLGIENSFKLILPSPTMITYRWIRTATRQKQGILLTGVTMGGGPSQWATEAHLRAGLPVYATPEAARSFNDDLNLIGDMGVTLVSLDEAGKLTGQITHLELRDFDFTAIAQVFTRFSVDLGDLAALGVAVFDHGNAPPGTSDRQFRFDYLDRRIREANRLSAFAYRAQEIPTSMTRMQAVAESCKSIDTPLVVMDTAPAAILGALYDPQVRQRPRVMITNVGNFHTLATRLGPSGIEGLFEHHTGLIDQQQLEKMVISLADGSLQYSDVFDQHGHGAFVSHHLPLPMYEPGFNVAVTGPRRNLLKTGAQLKPYYAAPFGDMMTTGCVGLLSAIAEVKPELSEAIHAPLRDTGNRNLAPWDVEV